MNLKLNAKEQEIFQEYKHLADIVTGNYLAAAKTHFLDKEDIEQFALIGLIKAIKGFDKNKGMKLKTHAYNHIRWEVNKGLRQYSLRKINKRDELEEEREAIYMVSTNAPTGEDNEEEVGSSIPDNSNSENFSLDKEYLKKYDEDLPKIVELRLKGYNFHEIGEKLGKSRQFISKKTHLYKRQILESFY